MDRSKMKQLLVVLLALSFFVWFALSSTSVYALGGNGGGNGGNTQHKSSSAPNQNDSNGTTDGNHVASVPEPATWLLVGSGLAGLALVVRKKLKK